MNASDGNNPSENNPSQNNQQRKGKGKQKVNMEKIENETNLQVTFSKRRGGLFKKASELSTLCGAESAIVVFSPGEKAHSFGHPDFETIANRFLNTNAPTPPRTTDSLLTAHNEATMRQRNQELINIEGQLEQERERRRELVNVRNANQSRNLFPPRIDELNYEQLDQLQGSIMGFKNSFENKLKSVTNLESPYVQEPNPEVVGGEGGGPWTTPGGPISISFPMGSNVQNDQFPHYAPTFADGSTNPFEFNLGAGNQGVANPTNHMASGSASLFVSPFDPNVGNFGSMVQYPHVAGGGGGGSDYLIQYNYGNPGEVVPYGGGTTSSNVELDGCPMETQANVSNKSQGFNSSYGRGDS